MCGIVSMLATEGMVSRQALEAGTRALYHRGPDGQKHWIAPHGRVGLGHARLSIIDLESGEQPIENEDGSIRVVVNGEFYDFERIRKELQSRGHTLRTHSDSEILLHLYEDYGVSCLRHLRGEFAFVLWDERQQLLFAGRDRFGIKPLYYSQHQGTLYLASEAKALFAAGVPAAWDPESFYMSVRLTHDSDRSLFRGVRQIPPGHYMLATRESTQLCEYWDLNYPLADAARPMLRDEEYIEQLHTALREATRLRLRADVPVGCYLSGGLDSSALIGLASAILQKPITAFTIAFDGAGFDESTIAEETAKKVGAEYLCFRMPESMLADHFADAIAQSEALQFNANGVAKFLLSQKVRDHGYKVVLTGEGADEILCGYPFFLREALMTVPVTPAGLAKLTNLGEAGRMLSNFDPAQASEPVRPEVASIHRVLGFVPGILDLFSRGWAFSNTLFAPDFAAEFASRDAGAMYLSRLNIMQRVLGREPAHQSMYLWTKTYLANNLLNFLGDRSEMGHSVEGRTPFLDHHLVETVVNMPLGMKIRDAVEKYVLREAARPYITGTIYNRRKHPFMAPANLNSGLRTLVEDTLRSESGGVSRFYNRHAIVAMLDRIDTLPAEMRSGLFGLLLHTTSAAILEKRYNL